MLFSLGKVNFLLDVTLTSVDITEQLNSNKHVHMYLFVVLLLFPTLYTVHTVHMCIML